MPVTRSHPKVTRWGGKPSAASRRKQIVALHLSGLNSVEIALMMGVSDGRIRQIIGEERRAGRLR